jgi:hypothetical protein
VWPQRGPVQPFDRPVRIADAHRAIHQCQTLIEYAERMVAIEGTWRGRQQLGTPSDWHSYPLGLGRLSRLSWDSLGKSSFRRLSPCFA